MYSLDFGVISSSFQSLLDPFTITMLFLGVLGGLVVGVMPGLGPTLAVALLIPLTYHLTPGEAFSILTAVYVGGMSGGAVSAILLRLPGTPASMATLLDGFPLANRGKQPGQLETLPSQVASGPVSGAYSWLSVRRCLQNSH